jgi:4-amino-4-deoxy-L-arabinose transferase-like glycosyltransferase
LAPWPSTRNLLAGVVAALVLYFCFFSGLSALGLVGPDEPRYAAVAREMYESGDWVTPRLHGQPWFEKPVLYYWGAAAAFHVFGVSEFAARLPSALAALAVALAMGALALRLYGPLAGWAALLIFSSSIGVMGFARAATTDMLFSAALGLAMCASAALALGHLREGKAGASSRTPGGVLFLWGVLLGAAVLAKGPAGAVLAGGSAGLWALVTGRWRDAFRLAHPAALAGFFLTALPWYVLCALRNPDFIDVFVISHNFKRYLTPVFQHEQPFWFYGPILLVGLLPWSFLLVGVARRAAGAFDRQRLANSAGFYFACWVIFPVVFFSLSKSKLPGYILPALPALVLLLAREVACAAESERHGRWLLTGVGATLVALAFSAGWWLRKLPPDAPLRSSAEVLPWLLLAGLAGAAVAALACLRRPAMALGIAALLIAGLVELANRAAVPALDAHLSPRAAAAALPAGKEQEVAVYRLHRAWHYGLNFYLHGELREWKPEMAPPKWIYASEDGAAELARTQTGARIVQRISRQAVLLRLEGSP